MSYPLAPQPGQPGSPDQPRERVAIGLLAAVLAVLAGMAVSVLLARLGFISGISSFVIALGAAYLYTAAAGRAPRSGLIPLIVLILVGVVASFFAVVASDLWDAYGDLQLAKVAGPSRFEFIQDNIFNGDVLAEYKRDAVFFAVFAALGVYGTIRRLLDSR